MIRLLYEDEATPLDVPSIGGDFHKDIKLYDVVKCAGYDWYVIGVDGDVVTLLAKNDDFGDCEFDHYFELSYLANLNNYAGSDVREYLESNVLPKVQSANPIPTELSDVTNEPDDKVWLLSVYQARSLPKRILEFDHSWWLRSPSSRFSDNAMCVYSAGHISSDGARYSYTFSVRPAMRVHISDLD